MRVDVRELCLLIRRHHAVAALVSKVDPAGLRLSGEEAAAIAQAIGHWAVEGAAAEAGATCSDAEALSAARWWLKCLRPKVGGGMGDGREVPTPDDFDYFPAIEGLKL